MDNSSIKHLEFVQNVITRLGHNSFLIKSWTVTLIAAISTLAASAGNNQLLLPAIFPTLLFWFLDSFYLQQERKFRAIYKSIYQVDGKTRLFEMNPSAYTDRQHGYLSAFFSVTIFLFYAGIIGLTILVYTLLANIK